MVENFAGLGRTQKSSPEDLCTSSTLLSSPMKEKPSTAGELTRRWRWQCPIEVQLLDPTVDRLNGSYVTRLRLFFLLSLVDFSFLHLSSSLGKGSYAKKKIYETVARDSGDARGGTLRVGDDQDYRGFEPGGDKY